jgi:hypothetical protein
VKIEQCSWCCQDKHVCLLRLEATGSISVYRLPPPAEGDDEIFDIVQCMCMLRCV